MPIRDDWKDLAVVAIDVIFHPVAQTERRRHHNRIRVHEMPYRLALKRLPNQNLLVTAPRRVVQKEANEAEPDSAEPLPRKELRNSAGDQQPGESLAKQGCPTRGLA